MAPSDPRPQPGARPAARAPRSPGPCRWQLPSLAQVPPGDLVAIGADLQPATLLEGYRGGLFAMPEAGGLGWWSPDPRGVLLPARVHVSRSLRRSLGRFEVSVDAVFPEVLTLCADPARPHGWISREYSASYLRLHELGWAHSVEVWQEGRLVGGLFGVEVGGLFAAESKAHLVTDASKVAVVALAELLDDGLPRLIDVQWRTDHLATLGVVEIPRSRYAALLARARDLPPVLQDQPPPGAPTRIRWRNG